ncbi:MAG TPA: hypothetical protein VHZ24_18815 [Pirellulales bacterium]|jgi:hypothetical protein|nr:hypothetical protein [Pirellulales bacterium]
MKMRSVCALLLFGACVMRAHAETPRGTKSDSTPHEISLGQLTPTPDMWFYDQAVREHSDPKAAVRRKAEFETAQRQQRMAAMAWYGMSASRPIANPTPHVGGVYSPVWASGGRDPSRWAARSSRVVVVPVVPSTSP